MSSDTERKRSKVLKKFGKLSEEDRKTLMPKLNELVKSSETAAEPKKGRKEKKEKDPNAPKRAMTPYLHFAQTRRSSAKNEHPELNPRDLSRLMGKEWNEMSEDAKRPYVEKGNRSKEQYTEAKKNYKKWDKLGLVWFTCLILN